MFGFFAKTRKPGEFGFFTRNRKPGKNGTQYITVTINARINPLDRSAIYANPLDEVLAKESIGEVTGGGTQLNENRETDYCELEIEVNSTDEHVVNLITSTLEEIGIPKRSKVTIDDTKTEIEFGNLEGLALYFNNTELSDEVYEKCDINLICDELSDLVEEVGEPYGYWNSSEESALYLYGSSFSRMNSLIESYIQNEPLCEKCRIVQIA